MIKNNGIYIDIETTTGKVRFFNESVNSEEFIWHTDDENREIEIIHTGVGWMFQYDNEFPFELVKGDVLYIDKGSHHRLHKGLGSLMIKIITNEKNKNIE